MTSHFVVSNICQEDPRRCGTGCHHGNYVSKEDWGCNTHGPLSSQLTFWQWSETSSTSQKVSGQATTHIHHHSPWTLAVPLCTKDGTTTLCPCWSPFRNTTRILRQYVPANKCQTKTHFHAAIVSQHMQRWNKDSRLTTHQDFGFTCPPSQPRHRDTVSTTVFCPGLFFCNCSWPLLCWRLKTNFLWCHDSDAPLFVVNRSKWRSYWSLTWPKSLCSLPNYSHFRKNRFFWDSVIFFFAPRRVFLLNILYPGSSVACPPG